MVRYLKYGEKILKALEVLRINPDYPFEKLKKEHGIGRTTCYDAKRIVKQELEDSSPFKGMEVSYKGWQDITVGQTVDITLSNFGMDATVGILSVDYKFDKNTCQSEKVIKFHLDKKVKDITDEITDLRKRLGHIEAEDRKDTDLITRLEQAAGSFIIVGSYWAVSTATQTGSTIYLSSSARIFTSGLASGTIQGVLAGSGTSIGSPFSPLTLHFSGGYQY